MPQRYGPGDLITAAIINDILARLEKLEGGKQSKESKEKDTKDTKEKDTKDTKEKDTKDTKEKDTKDTKDTKETKDTKDTKEASKDTKEQKESKENKESKEDKEEKEQKDRTKEAMSLKEKDSDRVPAPFNTNLPPMGFGSSTVNISLSGLDGEGATGRAFIREEERPRVGRQALELADSEPDGPARKPEEKQPESGLNGQQAEAVN